MEEPLLSRKESRSDSNQEQPNLFDQTNHLPHVIIEKSSTKSKSNPRTRSNSKKKQKRSQSEQRRAVGKSLKRNVILQFQRFLNNKSDTTIQEMKDAFETFLVSHKKKLNSKMYDLFWGDGLEKKQTIKDETIKDETIKDETIKNETIKDEKIKNETIKKQFRQLFITDYLQGQYLIYNIGDNFEHFCYFLPQLMKKAINEEACNQNLYYGDYVSKSASNDQQIQEQSGYKEQKQQDNDNQTEVSDQTMDTMASLADNIRKQDTPPKQKQSPQTWGQGELNHEKIPVEDYLTQQQENKSSEESNFDIHSEYYDPNSVQISRVNSTEENIDTVDLQHLFAEEKIPDQPIVGDNIDDQNSNNNQGEQREEHSGEQENLDNILRNLLPQPDQQFDRLYESDYPDFLQHQEQQELNIIDSNQVQQNQQFWQNQQGNGEAFNQNGYPDYLHQDLQNYQFLQNQQDSGEQQQQLDMFSEIFGGELDASQYREEQQFSNENSFEEKPYFYR